MLMYINKQVKQMLSKLPGVQGTDGLDVLHENKKIYLSCLTSQKLSFPFGQIYFIAG